MHHTLSSAESYFVEFFSSLAGKDWEKKVEVKFAVPYTLLASVAGFLRGKPGEVVAQNAHWLEKGAYTGEISLPMLSDIGVATVLIGHSERRQYYAETDQTVAHKVKAALAAGLTPILCVGENLAQRKAGETSQVISAQLGSVLNEIPRCGPLVIAYEPVWAIGTGLAATTEQAQEVHHLIRNIVSAKFPGEGQRVRLLYGGSVNSHNIAALMHEPDIDGALVGGAPLKGEDFAGLVKQL
jgi:triosephosphate isomerase